MGVAVTKLTAQQFFHVHAVASMLFVGTDNVSHVLPVRYLVLIGSTTFVLSASSNVVTFLSARPPTQPLPLAVLRDDISFPFLAANLFLSPSLSLPFLSLSLSLSPPFSDPLDERRAGVQRHAWPLD